MKTRLLRAALFTPMGNSLWGAPILMWGNPGVAKSAIVRQLGREYGLPVEVLSPACRGEGAFGVTPVPVGERMTYPRPDWTDRFEKEGRGIVFVDEINLCATHFAGALLGLLADKVLGSYTLPPGVRVIAAANDVAIAAASGGWDLSAPAANRVGHLDWPSPTAKEWTDWLLAEDYGAVEPIDCAKEEARVAAAWPEAWARARGVFAGFLLANSTKIHVMPPSSSPELSKAWASPRTYEYACRAWAASAVHGLADAERDELVYSFVGAGVGAELVAWVAKADLPDSALLLDGLVEWRHRPEKLDVTTAVFSSAAACVVQTEDKALQKKRVERMWGLLGQAVDDSADVVIPPAKLLAGKGLLGSSTNTVRAVKKIVPLLKACKIDVREGLDTAA